MPLNDFSSEDIAEAAAQVKRELEVEFHLPPGAVDAVGNDLIRLLVWRDSKEDPGPLPEPVRNRLATHYFNEIYAKKKARGDLIFKTLEEARGFLLDHGFRTTVRVSTFYRERGAINATILKSGVIFRLIVKDLLDNLIENEKGLQ